MGARLVELSEDSTSALVPHGRSGSSPATIPRGRAALARAPAARTPAARTDRAGLAAARGDLSTALAISDSVRTAFQRHPAARSLRGLRVPSPSGRLARRLGERSRADREWLWYEASDVEGWPEGVAQAGEVGAALGPFARLRRARALLGAEGSAADTIPACAHLARVRELWSDADSAPRTLLADPSFEGACRR